MTERRLLRALRLAMLAAMSAPLAACGGQVDPGTHYAPDSGGKCATSGLPTGTVPPCGFSVNLVGNGTTCGFPSDGGQISPELCNTLCGPSSDTQPTTYCRWDAVNDPTHLQCGNACEGRRPEHLRPRSVVFASAVAEYFARTAHLELAAPGAPAALRRAALRAAEDEVRHARMVGALARRFGGTVEAPVVERGPVRDLFAIALENALEGCVRETWGALQAAWQAEHAESLGVRAALRTIANDEARHALLGWKIAAWAESKLSAVETQRLRAARARAVDELVLALAVEPDASLVREAGLPRAEEAVALARSLFAELDGHLASRAA
jgi:hypothetical protein